MYTMHLKYTSQRRRTGVCLLILLLLLNFFTARSQENLSAIKTAFSQYQENIIREKIFVHTDKSFYVTGEIAWFKLYVLDASDNKPLELSKVAYVEILDANNRHMLRAKIALDKGEGNGSFYLPATLSSGNFILRAYTNWMKNFGPGYFFEKIITVVNVQKSIELPPVKTSVNYDVQFFPEGGNLVNNIPSEVAFKGTDEYGKGIAFTGVLLDNNDTVLTFQPVHAGMGVFNFTPVSGHAYKAVIHTADDKDISKQLPEAYNSGYVMHLADSTGKITVTVQSDILSGHEVYLFAHTRKIIKASLTQSFQNGKAVFVLDKNLLDDGISHITIFNELKQPVCERLYFKKPSKQIDIKVSPDQDGYTTRKKVNINIQAGNISQKNDVVSLSMSVYRLDSLQTFDAADINSYLFLTSELKGFVEDPGYYFQNNNEKTDAAIDNLVLTNGWRRFKWEDVLQNKKQFFQYVPEYDGSLITGTVINTLTGNHAANVTGYLSVLNFPNGFKTSVSDNDGLVKFELKGFYGSSEIMLQTNTAKDSTFRIDLSDPFSINYSGTPLPLFTLQNETSGSLRAHSVSMQVENIYSGKNIKRFTEPVIDTTAFYIVPDEKYLLDDYTRFITIEEVLREYVILADVKKREGNFHFSLLDFASNEKFANDPLVLLDGVPVFDLNRFMQVDPLKLKKLEVVNRKYFLGSSIFNGILNWTSYKGDLADYDPGPHATIIDYDGLQKEREFYSPAYASNEQYMNHTPDFRNVLLWSPHINMQGGSSKDVSFYTSDLPGKYVVVVQGISVSGLAASATTTFSINRDASGR